MKNQADDAVAQARRAAYTRRGGPSDALAAALEALATAQIESGDVAGGARSLEQAAQGWAAAAQAEREGNCLLLAASSHRLAGDTGAAAQVLRRAQSLAPRLNARLQRGVALEGCEQRLAAGRAAEAVEDFSAFMQRFGEALAPVERLLVLQRRAAAATVAGQWAQAGADFLEAARDLVSLGTAADVEAARLAAASALMQVDTDAAQRVLAQVSASVPADGGSAVRRGLVGGQVALRLGDPLLALQRFDAARQGALDAGDALSYATAALESSRAAEGLDDAATAYARLATAWATLGDKLGRDAAAGLVRPALSGLRERLGAAAFDAAKQAYEAQRRAAAGEPQRADGGVA